MRVFHELDIEYFYYPNGIETLEVHFWIKPFRLSSSFYLVRIMILLASSATFRDSLQNVNYSFIYAFRGMSISAGASLKPLSSFYLSPLT